MRLILAPHLDVGANPRPPMSWDELVRYGEVEVPSDTEASVHDVVSRIIGEQRPDLIGVEPQVDAPPFSAEWWWLATVRREGNVATVMPFEPADAFGIDEHGLVHFRHPPQMPLRYLAKAIAEGHYSSDEDLLVVTRPGEFGGNGFQITSLVLWLLQEFPVVLLGVGVDRVLLRHDTKRCEELEELAANWAGRHVLYPRKLKQFVESKNAWYPSVLAKRLGLSDAAARRLLDAVGYAASAHDAELMEFSNSEDAQAARRSWDDAEWEPTFTSLDELLDAGADRPEVLQPSALSEADWDSPREKNLSVWSRLRAWVKRR
ncbi:MAG: hypothetical protein Q8Q02_10665 [Nocardioides sp.]|nr:hypothetical protein [Nocardioides sp.]